MHRGTNTLVAKFSKASPFVRYRIFKYYCGVLYGAPLCDWSSSATTKVSATEQCFLIIRSLLNILDNIHDMVATVSTLPFGFPSCSSVDRITSASLVGLWVYEHMLFHYLLSHKC